MKKIKYFLIVSIILGGLIFLFSPEVFPENFQFQEFLNSASQNDVIIVFNSGGWGNTPLEEAEDFAPIIKGVQETLEEWGYTSFVVPYKRTKDGFFGKISGIKEVISPLQNQTEKLSKQIEEFLRENPNKKIIMAGLSNGAIFVDETMGKVSDDIKNKVLAIEIGIPFWKKKIDSENILRLDNKGKDTLAEGKTKILLSSLFKAPFKWILARITGENLAFSKAFYVPGHEYSWTKVKPEVNSFLENKLK